MTKTMTFNPQHAALFLMIAVAAITLATPASANTLAAVLCNIVYLLYSGAGRGISTIAVCMIGVAAMLGRVSWGMALTVAVGLGVYWGAPGILIALGVGGSC